MHKVNVLDRKSNPWNVYKHRNDGYKDNWLYLEPKPEIGHEYTLIFFHGLWRSSQDFLPYFVPYDENYLVPKNTKVVLPSSPTDQIVFKSDTYGLLKGNSWF